MLLLAVWWAWVYTTWATNWLNPDSTGCRLMLIGVMGAGLVMATSIPDAFGDAGLTFALAYAAIQVGSSSFVLWAMREDPVRRANFQRIVCGTPPPARCGSPAGCIRTRRATRSGSRRSSSTTPARRCAIPCPAWAGRRPRSGRSRPPTSASGSSCSSSWRSASRSSSPASPSASSSRTSPPCLPSQQHSQAQSRCGGSTSTAAPMRARRRMGRSDDPGRIARSAYTYSHLPMVAGIIVTAVGDELVIGHPTRARRSRHRRDGPRRPGAVPRRPRPLQVHGVRGGLCPAARGDRASWRVRPGGAGRAAAHRRDRGHAGRRWRGSPRVGLPSRSTVEGIPVEGA